MGPSHRCSSGRRAPRVLRSGARPVSALVSRPLSARVSQRLAGARHIIAGGGSPPPHPFRLWSPCMTRPVPCASVRLSFAAGALSFVALWPLAAQQAVEADRALLAQERYVTPPPEVARLVSAPRNLNSTLTQPSPDKR